MLLLSLLLLLFLLLLQCLKECLFAYIIPFILFCLYGELRYLCVPMAILRRCKRPYCAPTAISLHYYQNAKWRRLFWACSKCVLSPFVLCNPTAFTALPWRYRSVAFLSTACRSAFWNVFRTPFEHRPGVTAT